MSGSGLGWTLTMHSSASKTRTVLQSSRPAKTLQAAFSSASPAREPEASELSADTLVAPVIAMATAIVATLSVFFWHIVRTLGQVDEVQRQHQRNDTGQKDNEVALVHGNILAFEAPAILIQRNPHK